VYAHAKLIAADVQRMEDEIGAMRDLTLGTVDVGTSPGAAFTNNVLAQAIVRLSRKGRRLMINSRVGPRDLLIPPLLAGELDFVITVLSDDASDDLTQEELYRDPLLFVVRRKHPLARKSGITIGDLAGFPWIVPDQQAHVSLTTLARQAGAELQHTVIRCNASNLIKALVTGSDFIALMREDMARLDLEGGDYAKLALSGALTSETLLATQRMGLVTRALSAPSRAGEALMAEIRSFYGH
jgi:LysR family transcriptional regulator of gallate degradation